MISVRAYVRAFLFAVEPKQGGMANATRKYLLFPCLAPAQRRPSRPRPFFCPKHALGQSQQKRLKWDALAALTPPQPARQTPRKPCTKCRCHQHATFELSNSRDGVQQAEIQTLQAPDCFSTRCGARSCPFLPRARCGTAACAGPQKHP